MRNHAAQLAIIKQLSMQELHSTAGNCQADEQTLITGSPCKSQKAAIHSEELRISDDLRLLVWLPQDGLRHLCCNSLTPIPAQLLITWGSHAYGPDRVCCNLPAHQASLSFTKSQSLLRLISIESVVPSNHLILCCPFLLLPSVFPSPLFSSELALDLRQPK